jgi:hypothetical protein
LPANHRSRAYDASLAEGRTIQQYTICPNPDIVFYHNAPLAWAKPLGANGYITLPEFVIGWSEGAIRSDRHTAADQDAIAGIENAARINNTIRSNDKVAYATSRLDFDEGVYDRSWSNDNARSPYRVFNVSQ